MKWFHTTCADTEGMWGGGPFATRDEAIADGRANYDGEAFLVATGRKPDPAEYLPRADAILDMAGDCAADEGMADCNDWPDVTNGAEAELNALLDAWARKHAPIDWYLVDGTPEYIEPAAVDVLTAAPDARQRGGGGG